jgi:hypothetical protein
VRPSNRHGQRRKTLHRPCLHRPLRSPATPALYSPARMQQGRGAL